MLRELSQSDIQIIRLDEIFINLTINSKNSPSSVGGVGGVGGEMNCKKHKRTLVLFAKVCYNILSR